MEARIDPPRTAGRRPPSGPARGTRRRLLLLGAGIAAGRLVLACAGPEAARWPLRDAAGEEVVLVRRLAGMGTGLEIALAGISRPAALAASERAVQALEAVEARLSTWRPDSELARLNAAPAGVPQPLSPALALDLMAARRWWEATGGAFDPSVGDLVRLWRLREGGPRPGDPPPRPPDPADRPSFADLALAGTSAIRLDPRLVLEEGGFGKGVGLDAALAALRAAGEPRALLDLGGQLAFLAGARPWRVRVADPRARDRAVVELAVAGAGSLATSGSSERGIVADGVRLSHILDPRTARPAPAFGSVTVLAASATAADCLSTGLYAMGPDGALAWWRSGAGEEARVELLLLLEIPGGLRGIATPGLRDRLRVLAGDLSLAFLDPEPPSER
ncbi:MAG: FAD:protein FMN transferase [Planctomycetota bacterium]